MTDDKKYPDHIAIGDRECHLQIVRTDGIGIYIDQDGRKYHTSKRGYEGMLVRSI